jgi:hypothetical protein
MALYKYLTPARVDVLEGQRIRFTQPAAFNDPFEFRPCIGSLASQTHLREYVEQNYGQILERELMEYPIISKELSPEVVVKLFVSLKSRLPDIFQLLQARLLPSVSSAINSAFNRNLGILCLSEVRDSLLMWGHYTQNHEGFVIGFSQDHPYFSMRRGPEDEFGYLRRVKYSSSRPVVTLADTTGTEWFETKSDDWSYEKEWRMMRVLAEAERRIETLPYPVCLFSFPADSVAEIIIGLKASAEVRDRLKTLSKNFPNAKVILAQEHSSQYSLVMEPAE